MVSSIFILIYYKKPSGAVKIGFFYGVNIYKININKNRSIKWVINAQSIKNQTQLIWKKFFWVG